jgi:hypothetical protein
MEVSSSKPAFAQLLKDFPGNSKVQHHDNKSLPLIPILTISVQYI